MNTTMKARIKKTGEIVTLRNLHSDGTAIDVNGRYYHQGDISEFIEESNCPIDWEQRRYEIAKEVLAGYASNSSDRIMNANVLNQIETSIKIADALIDKLKGGKK